MSSSRRPASTFGTSAARWRVALGLFLLGTAPFSAARAYVLEGVHWPSNQPIVLGIQLGLPGGTLIDGSTSWNQVAESALSVWNPYLGSGVRFTYQETAVAPGKGDGNSTVFFSPTIFGESFGQDTLGITIYYYNPRTNVADEADVVFNSNQAFNSYRGDLRTSGSKLLADLRRVAIHEFGHVLGLDHVAQSAQAVMTPFTTDLDTVQADDIAGVTSLYGQPGAILPAITGGLTANGAVDQEFSYQIAATHSPTGYQATGLPDGIGIDTATGIISGTPTTAGTYSVKIQALNSAGAATAALSLTIAPAPLVFVTVTTPDVTIGSGGMAIITLDLSTPLSTDTLINYTLKGSAINGTDYRFLNGTKKIKAGLTRKKIKIVPEGDLDGATKKTVKFTLAPGTGYTVGTTDPVKLKIRAAEQ